LPGDASGVFAAAFVDCIGNGHARQRRERFNPASLLCVRAASNVQRLRWSRFIPERAPPTRSGSRGDRCVIRAALPETLGSRVRSVRTVHNKATLGGTASLSVPKRAACRSSAAFGRRFLLRGIATSVRYTRDRRVEILCKSLVPSRKPTKVRDSLWVCQQGDHGENGACHLAISVGMRGRIHHRGALLHQPSTRKHRKAAIFSQSGDCSICASVEAGVSRK
jgi:hypothetical protein